MARSANMAIVVCDLVCSLIHCPDADRNDACELFSTHTFSQSAHSCYRNPSGKCFRFIISLWFFSFVVVVIVIVIVLASSYKVQNHRIRERYHNEIATTVATAMEPMYEIKKVNKSNRINNARKADITLQRTRLLYIFHDSTVFTLDLALLFYCVSVWIILCLMYNHHYTLSCLYHSCFCGRLAYLSTSTCLNLCSNMLFFSSLLFLFRFLVFDVCLFLPFPCPPVRDAVEHKSKRIHIVIISYTRFFSTSSSSSSAVAAHLFICLAVSVFS